jgi:hypothetical protein
VNDALLVCRRQTLRDLHSAFDRLPLRQRSSVQRLAHTLALQQLRHQEGCALVLTYVVYGKNVGMIQGRYRTRFLLETVQAIRITGIRFGKNFNCDVTAEPRVAGAVNLSHPPCT